MLQVIIKQVLSEEIISVLYIDYGTSSKVHFKDVRLIHKKFLSLPAQVIPARLWGITENEDMVSISRSKLTKMMIVGNFSNKVKFCVKCDFQVPFGRYTPMSSHKWEKLKEYRCYNCDYKATVRRGVTKHMDQCDEIEN